MAWLLPLTLIVLIVVANFPRESANRAEANVLALPLLTFTGGICTHVFCRFFVEPRHAVPSLPVGLAGAAVTAAVLVLGVFGFGPEEWAYMAQLPADVASGSVSIARCIWPRRCKTVGAG